MKNHNQSFWKEASGSSAVEFAMVLPIVILVIIGAIYLSLMMYAASSLHYAVEEAARCRSVKAAVCTDDATTQAYALARMKAPGFSPKLTASSFAVSLDVNCGYKVTVTDAPFTLRTGLSNLSVPISATACFPKIT